MTVRSAVGRPGRASGIHRSTKYLGGTNSPPVWVDNKQAPSTVARQYSCLRAAFAWAEASDIIARTPCRSIRTPRVELVDRPVLTAGQRRRSRLRRQGWRAARLHELAAPEWKPATEAAGLPTLKFHDLRSMAATALVAAGVDIKTAQTRLGHSSPTVTLGIYARATVEADRLAADKVGAFFSPSRVQRAAGRGAQSRVTAKGVLTCGFTRGRYGTRTHDLSRVKAAL